MRVSGYRFALAGVAVAALLLGGCGRKGMLEAPPTANSASAPSAQQQTGLGEPEHAALEGERTVEQQQASTPAKKTFFLDWLLN